MRVLALVAAILFLPAAASGGSAGGGVTVTHALSEFGTPKYGPDFAHFDYADPDAPKGGTLRLTSGSFGFDSLNWLPVQGEAARSIASLVYDSLMVESQDEVRMGYGLLAETVEYPEDASWAVFNLRPEARFSDGEPVTAADVAWTVRAYQDHAQPFYKTYVAAIDGIEVLDDHRIRFSFSTTGTLKPIVQVAGLPILASHWWQAEGRDIRRSTLQPPVGSGPYRLAEVDPGRKLVYERNPDYWGRDLPVNRGLWNFDRIEYDYYRDRTVEFEAFKAGQSDFRHEYTALFWATGYDVPAIADGRMIKTQPAGREFRGMQGYFFNTRRPQFADPRVRQALGLVYPFEWVNRSLFHGLYRRLDTWFLAPGYGATGLPDAAELALLEPYRDRLPASVFDSALTPPVSDGSGADRRLIGEAQALLKEAGWVLRGNALVHGEGGEPLRFEVLASSANFERVTQPWISVLRRLGVEATIRIVDTAQYQARYQDRQFDVITFAHTFYPPPGREELARFSSPAADQPGSTNLSGIRDPVVDALLERMLAATTLEEKQAATRALDRVLRAGHYVVPHWYRDGYWVAYWNRFGFPDIQPPYDFGYANSIAFQPTWWIDPEKDAALNRRGRT